MNTDKDKRLSKFMSLVLRHNPGAIGLSLDKQGWADIDELVAKGQRAGKRITREAVQRVVENCDKQRFALSETGSRIRASQGHSIDVELGLSPVTPPDVLYHGTATRFLSAIQASGLSPQRRQHVHLSADVATAQTVGGRHGKPVILAIDARRMHAEGHAFYVSENGVWLADAVPRAFFDVLQE